MAHISRIVRYTKDILELFRKMGVEQERLAYNAFQEYLRGGKFQGRNYNNLARFEFFPAFAGISQILYTSLGEKDCVATAILGTRGVEALKAVTMIAKPGFEIGGKYLAAQQQGVTRTYEAVVLKRMELEHSRANQRATQLQQEAEHIKNLYSSLLRTATGG